MRNFILFFKVELKIEKVAKTLGDKKAEDYKVKIEFYPKFKIKQKR